MTTLTYNIVATQEVTEEVEGLRVTAHCSAHCNNDTYIIDLDFDCTEAFDEMRRYDIEEIILKGGHDCRAANFLAEYYKETRTSPVFYILQSNQVRHPDAGYGVEVNIASAIEWLKVNRPYWWEQFMKDENLREVLTYETKNPN